MTHILSNTRKVSLIALFAALYVVLSFIPISVFIGAPSFLSLNLILIPVVAYVFQPTEALFSSLLGGIIGFYLNPGQAMFGLPTILLPSAGAYFGSNSIHNEKKGSLLSIGFLLIAVSLYLIRNFKNPLFISPHTIAIILLVVILTGFKISQKIRIIVYSFISTMCEQGMMMIFAVYILGLPGGVFDGILTIMIYERLVATLGGTLLIFAIDRSMPDLFK